MSISHLNILSYICLCTPTNSLPTKDGLNNGGLPTSNTSRGTDSNPGSATEEALMAAERLFGCKIIRQQNPEGRVTFIIATDNGQKLDFDEKQISYEKIIYK